MSWLFHQRRIRARTAIACATAVALLITGCSTKANTVATAGGSLITGPGVTDQVIKLGVLTDRTGSFAGLAKSVEQGRQLFWENKNSQGGVCGRRVEFVVKDHGYNTQHAATAYAQLKDDVLALDELLGSPMIAALLPDLQSDEMLTMVVSWSSNLLANPYVVVTGTTYDIEMINGVHWLTQHQGLSKDDKIGHIYLEGDYGENAAAGSRAAAAAFGLKLIEHKIKPTDSDLTGQVAALRKDGAEVVLLSTTPAQTASAVAVAAATGLDATFVASNPAYNPSLLNGPARSALEKKLLVMTSTAPFSSPATGPGKVRDAFLAKYPGEQKSAYVMYGYAQGEIMAKVLDAACQRGFLTRAGLLEAFRTLRNVTADDLVPALDYGEPGQIPTRQVYLTRPDANADGGLVQVEGLFAAPLAESYRPRR